MSSRTELVSEAAPAPKAVRTRSLLWRRWPDVRPVHLVDALIFIVAAAATLRTVDGRFLTVDTNFDLRYYHSYAGWALFNDGVNRDLHPAGVGSYLNPALDAINYLALSQMSARMGSLLLLAIQLSSALPVYWIARTVLPMWRRSFAGGAALLSLGGSLVVVEWGTSFGDLTSAPLILWGVALVLNATTRSTWRLVVAGFLVGAAVGVKLTNGPAGVASCVLALFLVPRVWPLLRYGVGLAVGFAAAAGPWMWVMWQQTGNPVFPLFNNHFRSPYGITVMSADGRFGGKGLGETLMLPFKMVAAPAGLTSELPSSDWRWPLWAISVVLVVVLVVLQLPGSPLARAHLPERWGWEQLAFRRLVGLQLFMLTAFLLWARIFGIQRYAIVMEILTVPAVIAVLGLLTVRLTAMTGLTLLFAVGLGWNTVAVNWGRLPMPDGPAIPPGSVTALQQYSTIIVAATPPSSYVAVAVGGETSEGTRPVWLGEPYTEADRQRGLERLVPGRIGILVRADAGDPAGPAQQAAEWFDLRPTGQCDPVAAIPFGEPMLICGAAGDR